MTWFRRKPAPHPAGRLTPSEAIIISRSGHTEESWDRLAPPRTGRHQMETRPRRTRMTDQERQDLRDTVTTAPHFQENQ